MIPQPIVDAFNAAHSFSLDIERVVVWGRVGSHSHGTYIPPDDPNAIDDIDYLGVIVPPKEYLLGLATFSHWTWKHGQYDVVVYSLQKFMGLLAKANPNVLATLWLHPEDVVLEAPAFTTVKGLLRNAVDSKAVAHATIGYAYDQLKRMTAFSLERIDEYERYEQHFGEYAQDVLRARDHLEVEELALRTGLSADAGYAFRKLHREHFSGYQGAKRKRMVREHGFDAKCAAHCIRLMRMGAEFVESGVLQVRRTDAEELKAIKRGQWSLEQVKAEAERLFAEMEELLTENPGLPETPDRETLSDLTVFLHEEVLCLTP